MTSNNSKNWAPLGNVKSFTASTSPEFYAVNYYWKHAPRRMYTLRTEETKWELVRYDLERFHDLHKSRSYIIGYRKGDSKELKANDVITATDVLMLIRGANPPNIYSYVPQVVIHREIRKKIQELVRTKYPDDPLQQMIQVEALYNSQINKLKTRINSKNHPSLYKDKVPAWYYCNNCGTYGDHYVGMCQGQGLSIFIPLHKRMKPSGIPSSNLRPATEEEARNVAMQTADGKFVMRKN